MELFSEQIDLLMHDYEREMEGYYKCEDITQPCTLLIDEQSFDIRHCLVQKSYRTIIWHFK
jgi:hypothetical protein